MTEQDYYPFGMPMPGRSYTVTGATYRFGFNGKEKDNEPYGEGDEYDFGARMYDSRLGRWFSCDPFQDIYPAYTPYGFALNSPIQAIDVGGNLVIFGSE